MKRNVVFFRNVVMSCFFSKRNVAALYCCVSRGVTGHSLFLSASRPSSTVARLSIVAGQKREKLILHDVRMRKSIECLFYVMIVCWFVVSAVRFGEKSMKMFFYLILVCMEFFRGIFLYTIHVK